MDQMLTIPGIHSTGDLSQKQYQAVYLTEDFGVAAITNSNVAAFAQAAKEQAKELAMRVDNAMQDDVNGDLALTWTEFSGSKPKKEPAHTLQRALLEVDAAGGQLGGRDAEHYEL